MRKILFSATAALALLGCPGDTDNLPPLGSGLPPSKGGVSCATTQEIDVAYTITDFCIEGEGDCSVAGLVKVDACPKGEVFKCEYDDGTVLKVYGSLWSAEEAEDFCDYAL